MPRRRVAILGRDRPTPRLLSTWLTKHGVPSRLSGRGEVDLGDRRSLRAFLDGYDVVVNDTGDVDRVVGAAVEAGIPYLDTCRDPEAVATLTGRFRFARTPIVAGCAVEAVVGDMAAALAAENVGGICSQVEVHQDVERYDELTAEAGVEVRHVWFPHGVVETAPVPWVTQVHVARHVGGASVAVTARTTPRPVEPGKPRPSLLSTLAVAGAADGERCLVAVVAEDVELLSARVLASLCELVDGEGPMAPAESVAPERFLDHVRDTGEPRALEWAISMPHGWFTPE